MPVDEETGDIGLREVFKRRRCLPEAGRPLFRFNSPRRWVLEENSWTSHRLVTTIAAIILREHIGYSVDLNYARVTSRVYHRVAKRWEAGDGRAVDELRSQADVDFSYANMEVWPEGKQDAFRELHQQGKELVNLGRVGYEGRNGWFVAEAFARRPDLSITPEFYRAYDVTSALSRDVLLALRNYSVVSCEEASGSCCCGSASGCAPAGSDKVIRWCPSRAESSLPAILATDPYFSMGFNEEIAQTKGFNFGLIYLRNDFKKAATDAFLSGAPQIVHAWRPSEFLQSLFMTGVGVVRIVMPSEGCGRHAYDGTGDWSCDFPQEVLHKVTSLDVAADPIVLDFLTRFYLPDLSMSQLLTLVIKDSSVDATADVIFDAACEWIRSNEGENTDWTKWVKSRNVPFFADTTHAWYPWPTIGLILFVASAYVLFMENPWLVTTLSFKGWALILKKNKDLHWRSELEVKLMRLRRVEGCLDASPPEPKTPQSDLSTSSGLPICYWKGLAECGADNAKSREFWAAAEAWAAEARTWREPLAHPAEPPVKDYVTLAHHTFPCLADCGAVAVPLCRSPAGALSGTQLTVELVVEESGGGATKGRDFEDKTHVVTFGPGVKRALVYIPVVYHEDKWSNSYWFQVRILKATVTQGEVGLACPAVSKIYVLAVNQWPANILSSKRGGQGVALLRYFFKQESRRRGVKFRKTMIAMLWMPVHTVFVSTVVQKVLVDHAALTILNASDNVDTSWFYYECLVLVSIQLASLGLNRWADVVHTRNRGKTGGVRQHHRADLLRKFMHMEHSEHWGANDSHWLYSTIYDADVITSKAYFQCFVLAQSCFALLLSVLLVIGLALWGDAINGSRTIGNHFVSTYLVGIFLIIPLAPLAVWSRRRLTWLAVIARKNHESSWFRASTWIVMNWKHLFGLSPAERVQLEIIVSSHNKAFVPAHWDARDTMNDTGWVTHWIQGISYCIMLTCGIFALIDYQTYGIGAMEVGTFYALCKIYLNVGKYTGRLSENIVDMQQAVVSLREIAALLNQRDQSWLRRTASRCAATSSGGGKRGIVPYWGRQGTGQGAMAIFFDARLSFVRPSDNKVGATFAELRLRAGCELPMGRLVHVTAANERILRSFLGLAAQVIHPTGTDGEELPMGGPTVHVPEGKTQLMLPMVAGGVFTDSGGQGRTVAKHLESTGAPAPFCRAIASYVGLDPDRDAATLGNGSAQVFTIIRALLIDPDVLCAFRPLAVVPCDVKRRMALLLRLWQGAGGLPHLAALLGVSGKPEEAAFYRSASRTLVVGNSREDLLDGFPADVVVDLEELLWKGYIEDDFIPKKAPTYGPRSTAWRSKAPTTPISASPSQSISSATESPIASVPSVLGRRRSALESASAALCGADLCMGIVPDRSRHRELSENNAAV